MIRFINVNFHAGKLMTCTLLNSHLCTESIYQQHQFHTNTIAHIHSRECSSRHTYSLTKHSYTCTPKRVCHDLSTRTRITKRREPQIICGHDLRTTTERMRRAFIWFLQHKAYIFKGFASWTLTWLYSGESWLLAPTQYDRRLYNRKSRSTTDEVDDWWLRKTLKIGCRIECCVGAKDRKLLICDFVVVELCQEVSIGVCSEMYQADIYLCVYIYVCEEDGDI